MVFPLILHVDLYGNRAMIGLRPENDRASTSFFSANANRKTYRFAERNAGRFFVSGISGSFAKYTKQLQKTDQKYLHQTHEKQENKFVHEPVLEKHQREELRREAQRLLEMEEQLAQLQRMRELKRQRDRARRKRKLEYMSACCIQRAFRHYALYKRRKSADLIVSFLRTVAAQQALSAAFWASSVLKRFAIKSSYLWKERQLVRSAARRVARASWAGVQEVASLWTLARRRATDELIFTAVKEGTARAAKAVLESGKYLRPPKKEKGRKLKGSAAKAVPSRRRRKVQAASGKAGDNAQFFLTEFDDGGSGPGRGSSSGGEGYDDYSSSEAGTARGDGGSDSEDFHPSPTRASVRFINKERASVEDLTASALAALRLSKRQKPVKVFDPNISEHRRIIELHKKKVQEFATERIRRMQQVDTRREQEERAAAERRQAEELQRAVAEQQKKEFAEKLAQEERAKARMMAKVRADREAARLKREAQEKAEAAECSAMQAHDKPCHQQQAAQPGITRGRSMLKRRGTNTGSLRPTSSLRSVGSSSAMGTAAEATGANANAAPAPAPPPRRPVVKSRPAVDQAALDHQYYQQALPPKRPGVPRMASVVDSAVKHKKEEEQAAAIEQEALMQLELRRAKFTSEEAVRRSRLAVQRRVAARLQREAEQAKAQEDSEAGKREKLQQIAELAALRLKADLEKKKRKEADRRRELGIDTPPDPYAISITQPGAKARRRKKGQKGKTGAAGGEVSESDAALSETEPSSAAGSGAAAARYASASSVGQDEPDMEQEDEQQEDGDEGDDSDSLDAVMSGLTRKLRLQGGATVPAPSSSGTAAGLKLDTSFRDTSFKGLQPDTAVGTRSSSAGANDPSGTSCSIHRNTASGGVDPRKPLNTALYTPSRHTGTDAGPRSTGADSKGSDDSDGAFERADITSAHETYQELMHDFGAEEFLRQGSVVQLFRTDTAGALVEVGGGLGAAAEQDAGPRRRRGEAGTTKTAKPKIQTGSIAKKPIAIPKQLQNTPYFQHFKKHSSLAESQSQPVGAFPTAADPDGVSEAVPQPSKLPLLARKRQQQKHPAGAERAPASQHSASSPALLVNEDLLAFQAKQGMKPGKVASLLEMVTRARNKLHRYGNSGLGTDASDTDTDAEHGATVAAGKGAATAIGAAAGSQPLSSNSISSTPGSMTLSHSQFRPASDAQLDAMVPSLQPPSMPQPVALASQGTSFRKTQPNIPLPPLSRDNLTILLKGKHPDSFSALPTGGTPAGSVKAAPSKKVSRKVKAGDSAGKEDSSREGATTEGAAKSLEKAKQDAKGQRVLKEGKKAATKAMQPAAPSAGGVSGVESVEDGGNPGPKKQAPKKVNYSELRANIARNAGLASGRYATAGQDGDSEDEAGDSSEDDRGGGREEEEEEEDEEDLMAGWVEEEPRETRQTVPAKEPAPQRQGRSGSKARRSSYPEEDADDDGEEDGQLEREYIRLREQFNAKLQQAAALNQLRQSTEAGAGAGAGGDPGAGVAAGGGQGLVASGKVTQSYSEGHARVSTQDLLRMWELEDAAEEVAAAQLRASRRHGDEGGEEGRRRQQQRMPSANQQLSPGTADTAQGQESSDDEGLGYGARGRGRDKAAAAATPRVPVPGAALAIDDPALDDHFLAFMNNMANKITTKQ